MNPADQADSGGDWRRRLRDMRTLNALRAEAPAPEAIQRLSDRALRAAAQNPDHSAAARAGAAEALAARSIAISPWRLAVPGFLTRADLAKGEGLFFGWGRRVRMWSGALGGLGAALALAGAAWLAAREESVGVGVGDLVFAAAALAPLALWFIAVAFRAKPARVAVLAPGPSPLTRAPLARFIRRELGPFGHVLKHAGAGPIRSAARYRAAADAMANKLAMNLRAARPGAAALDLGASPAWADLARALGAASADVVVVDLSQDAPAQIAHVEAWAPRAVFVALWGRADDAQAALAAHGLAHACFYYAPDGEMQRRGSFRAAMLAAMRATHGAP